MSGHSKWATIKRKKGANDQARGRIFSRLAREVMVAAREGGGDPEMNPKLRLVVQKARKEGMPLDTVDRAIKKGTGELEGGATLEECCYEGYGASGVAIMIDALTDNKNRTVGEIRAVFNKLGGSLGESGCVGYMFETKGVIQIDSEDLDEEAVLDAALEAGAEDLNTSSAGFEVVCAAEELSNVVQALTDAGLNYSDFQLSRVPNHTISLDADGARKVLRLLDALEELEDVQRISSNFDLDDAVMAALDAENG